MAGMSEGSLVELSEEPLSLERYVAAVADDGAGAISTFIGVTRNTFQGRRVVWLEYEAYAPMVCLSQHSHALLLSLTRLARR